jgi:hypothetical protein
MEHMSEKFGRGVVTLELRDFVQIAVVELSEQRLQELRGPTDVDDHTIRVELGTPELHVDNEGGAVKPLSRAEDFTCETVSDHHVVADRDPEHAARLA